MIEGTGGESAAGMGELGARLGAIPGSVWRHPKTKGYYWTLESALIPQDFRGTGRRTSVPLIATGMGRATRARGVAAAVQRRLWKQWHGADGGPIPKTTPQLMEEFKAFCRLKGSEAQARQNQRVAAAMMAFAGVTRPADITDADVEAYLAGLAAAGRAANTIAHHRASLHKFGRFLVKRGVLDGNPAGDVEVKDAPRKPPRYLDDFAVIRALSQIATRGDADLLLAACVAVYAAPRLGSLMALQCEHVQPAALVVPLSKTGDYAIVPFHDPIIGPELARACRLARGNRERGPLFRPRAQRTWGVAFNRAVAGLPTFGELPGTRSGNAWHLLRATAAVNWARRGATQWQIMAWGGWKSPAIVMRYINIARAAGMA